MTRAHDILKRPRNGQKHRAFSLLEGTIAVAVLGIGLIMIAAVFPVALTQHRENADQAAANQLATKANAMLASRFDTSSLWIDPTLGPSDDSPWYALPTYNLPAGAALWDAMPQGTAPNTNWYANWLNGAAPPLGNTADVLRPLDVLSDRYAPFSTAGDSFSPFTDGQFQDAAFRYTWYGFYRRLSSGEFRFNIALCKQRRGQLFAEQNVTTASPFVTPAAARVDRRIPAPWRVRVNYLGGRRIGTTPGGVIFSALAPVGSRVMIYGPASLNGALTPTNTAGRVLTVVSIFDDNTVDVLEDSAFDDVRPLLSGAGAVVTLDLWVFPPSVVANSLTRESPLVEWRTSP